MKYLALVTLFLAAAVEAKSEPAKKVTLAKPYETTRAKVATAAESEAFKPETDPNKKHLNVYDGTSPNTRRKTDPGVIEQAITSAAAGSLSNAQSKTNR